LHNLANFTRFDLLFWHPMVVDCLVLVDISLPNLAPISANFPALALIFVVEVGGKFARFAQLCGN
jgi:hypothetical protein